MTATAFELPSPEVTDAEEGDELARLTGSLNQPTSDDQLDAVASDAMRVMAEEDQEITRYRKTLAAEIQRILARYGSLINPHEARRARAESLVEECAKRAQFVGKAKSRKVGNGQYGRRQIPEAVEIVDEAKALIWLRQKAAGGEAALRTKTEIDKKIAKGLVLVNLAATGEVAEGFNHIEAHDKPFASPLAIEAV
jgi:phage host-nuclease inhibitor protein Gam